MIKKYFFITISILFSFVISGQTQVQNEIQKLLASDNDAGDNFGKQVSISGDKVLVTSSGDDDNGGSSGSSYFFNLNPDILSPSITLTRNNPQTIALGGSYTELGATASDDTDGDITNNIVIDASNVNTNAVGSYTVTYNVQDATGNAATKVTRTLNVIQPSTITGNWHTVGQAGFSDGFSQLLSLDIDNNETTYLAYRDDANASKMSVMKYDGQDWVFVGNKGFTSSTVTHLTLKLDNNNVPYVAYLDGSSNKANVLKFDGSNWVNVGSPDFSDGVASFFKIDFDSNNTPYVAYSDLAPNNLGLTVMKFDGNSWQTVGQKAFTTYGVNYIDLIIDSNDAPIVSFPDGAYSNKISVMKYNGVNWSFMGSAGFSLGRVSNTAIALDDNNHPYVLFRDYANADKATVMSFDGSIWNAVGSTGISKGLIAYADIVIDTDNKPVITFCDLCNSSYEAVVMKFNDNEWKFLGTQDFSPIQTQWNQLTISNTGKKFFAYTETINGSKPTVKIFNNSITNTPPTATNVRFKGTIKQGEELTGIYSYNDDDNDAENGTTYQWFRSDATFGSVNEVNKTPIQGATQTTYTPIIDDINKFLSFEVTPNDGLNSGNSVESVRKGPVKDNAVAPNSGGNWQTIGVNGFSNINTDFQVFKLDTDGVPYVAYIEESNSNKVTVKKFDGNNWVNVGNESFTDGNAYNLSLVLDNQNIPYISFTQIRSGYPNRVQVYKLNANNWVKVGNLDNTEGIAHNQQSLAFDTNNNLFFAYRNSANNGKPRVMKFDGQNWNNVGLDGFFDGSASEIGISLDSNNIPYVVFAGGTYYNNAVVMKFDGNSWTHVGPTEFSEGQILNPKIAIDSNNTPYIVYRDALYANRISVRIFDGNNWNIVGERGFSTDFSVNPNIIFDSNDVPYVNFAEGMSNSTSVTSIMKFTNNEWFFVGNERFLTGVNLNTSIAIDQNNKLFLAYSDGSNSSKTTVKVINEKPVATNIMFSGILKVGEELTGSYSYSDPNNDTENGTTYQWFRSDDGNGTNKVVIQNATNIYYTLTSNDENKYISFKVTPKDSYSFGSEVESNLQGAIGSNLINNPNFTLAENGVTCLCENAAIGEQGTLTINGLQKTFTKRTEQQLRNLINVDENDPQIALTCTSGITDMTKMFWIKLNFNQDISHWDVSDVTTMESMFEHAQSFNQNIGNWDVSSVVYMDDMFKNASSFNQPIGSWNVSNVTRMRDMFEGATSFNQDLSTWCVSKIPTEPSDFATNSPLQNNFKPIWGSCINIEDVPEALDDTYTMEEGEVLKIRPLTKGINDSEPNDLDIHIYSIAGEEIDYDNLPQTITVLVANKIVGVVNFNAEDDILFTPSVTGTITFPYVIKNTNDLSATANQIIEVVPLPEGANNPEALDDSYTMEEGEVLKIRPLSKGINDSDPNDLDIHIYSIAGEVIDYDNLPQTITVTVANTEVGIVNFNSISEILFTPSVTGTITFPYIIQNTNGLSATANQIIEVIPLPEGANDPEALDDSYTMEEGETLKIRPIKKGIDDSDPNDLDIHIFSIAGEEIDYDNLPQNITVLVANTTVGVVNFNAVDDILFTPSVTGTITFPYVIQNTNGLSATANQIIEVIPLPEGANNPEALDDSYTMEEGETLKIRPIKKGIDDSDPNDLDIHIFSIAGEEIDYDNLPQTITLTLANTEVGIVNFNSVDDIIFIPSVSGTITFPYEIKNTISLSATANQIIEVIPIPQGANNPIALNDYYHMEDDEELKIRPLTKGINDSDPNDLDIHIFSIAGEEIDYDNLPQIINVENASKTIGVVNFNNVDDITFTTTTDSPSIISFPYTIRNSNNNEATASQFIEVEKETVNENAPNAVNDTYTVDQGSSIQIQPLTRQYDDTDPNNLPLQIIKFSDEEVTGSAQNIQVHNGLLQIDNNSNITFTPNPTFFGTLSFTYTITNINDLTDIGLITIIVDKVRTTSQAPMATDDIYTIEINEIAQLNPLETGVFDSDPGGNEIQLTYINGEEITRNNAQIEVPNGKVIINSTDDIRFVPETDFVGDIIFSYQINNLKGESDTGLQQISVMDNKALSTQEYLNNNFVLYPNPTREFINIKTNINVSKIEVYDILGKKVFAKIDNKSIEVKHLPNGFYFLKLHSEQGIGIKKFVKE